MREDSVNLYVKIPVMFSWKSILKTALSFLIFNGCAIMKWQVYTVRFAK